jgi:hypothetical protein
MQKHLTAVLLALALQSLAIFPLVALAQAPSGNLQDLWEISVKSGHKAQFETAFRNYMEHSQKANYPRHLDVYTPDTGSVLDRYVVLSCCYSWADQDAYSAWHNQNPALLKLWDEEVAGHVESLTHYYYEMDFANSHWPDSGTAPAMMGVSKFSLVPGKVAQVHAARAELSQIAINQGWASSGKHWTWSDRIGGEPAAFLVVPFANYAAMTPGEQQIGAFLVEHMGPEKAAGLMDRITSSVSSSSYGIWVHRPDLSSRKD